MNWFSSSPIESAVPVPGVIEIQNRPAFCARPNPVIDTTYILNQYARMMRLFSWMNVDGPSLVYGLDHVAQVSGKVMCI